MFAPLYPRPHPCPTRARDVFGKAAEVGSALPHLARWAGCCKVHERVTAAATHHAETKRKVLEPVWVLPLAQRIRSRSAASFLQPRLAPILQPPFARQARAGLSNSIQFNHPNHVAALNMGWGLGARCLSSFGRWCRAVPGLFVAFLLCCQAAAARGLLGRTTASCGNGL